MRPNPYIHGLQIKFTQYYIWFILKDCIRTPFGYGKVDRFNQTHVDLRSYLLASSLLKIEIDAPPTRVLLSSQYNGWQALVEAERD